MDDDAVLKGHMAATVRLRELGLHRARLAGETLESLTTIARLDGRSQLAEVLDQHRISTTRQLEALAEAQYQLRLLHYALCLMEHDHSFTADEAIAHAETVVLESVIGD